MLLHFDLHDGLPIDLLLCLFNESVFAEYIRIWLHDELVSHLPELYVRELSDIENKGENQSI